ncbi:MAG: hypothetical protein ACOX41_03410 [Anaerovoracaceae bacterium]|jgi:hypothetical protein
MKRDLRDAEKREDAKADLRQLIDSLSDATLEEVFASQRRMMLQLEGDYDPDVYRFFAIFYARLICRKAAEEAEAAEDGQAGPPSGSEQGAERGAAQSASIKGDIPE